MSEVRDGEPQRKNMVTIPFGVAMTGTETSHASSSQVSIDQLESCLHQLLPFRVGELVHRGTVPLHDQSSLAFRLPFQLGAFHKLNLRFLRQSVNKLIPEQS